MNLTIQEKVIMSASFYKRSSQNVQQKGVFWDNPPTLIVHASHPLQHCWVDFFRMPVFNWIPGSFMGKDWKPKCPNCGNACVQNRHNNAPFIVFDQYQNYWLNAPEKFRCRTCEGAEGSKQFFVSNYR